MISIIPAFLEEIILSKGNYKVWLDNANICSGNFNDCLLVEVIKAIFFCFCFLSYNSIALVSGSCARILFASVSPSNR